MWITVTILIFQTWNIYSYLVFSRAMRRLNSQENNFGTMTGNVVISNVDALTFHTKQGRKTGTL
jgi:hypothetical protein